MVLAWLGMEQLVERKISFFACGMSASFIITSLLVGHVIGWGLHLFDCSFLGFGPFLDAPPCFITYPPVPDPHMGGCHRETAVAIPSPFFFMKFLPLSKKDR